MCRFVSKEGKNKGVYGPNLFDLRALRETADYAPEPPSREELEQALDLSEEMMDYYLKKALPPKGK
jgi:hypothetical protein